MKKLLACFFACMALVFSTPALAQSANNDKKEIPERNGDYADPEHPGIRVRVFVHEPKDARGSSPITTSCPDNNAGTPTTPAAGWHLPNGTWTYRVNAASVSSSVSSNTSTIIFESFKQWNEAQTKVLLKRGDNTNANKQAYDGQNIVAWGRTQGTALAVTYIRYIGGTVVDVDTIMNLKFPWSWTPYSPGACGIANTYDAQDILTHETGHWMGLNDTYSASYTDNTMYGYGAKGEIKKDTLTTGDINGVKAIYP